MKKSQSRMSKLFFSGTGRVKEGFIALTLVCCVCVSSGIYAEAEITSVPALGIANVAASGVPGIEMSDGYSRYSFTLEEWGAIKPIELRTVNGQRSLSFSVRSDEVITAAKLSLDYAWSPALIPELSHLKVLLNDELMATLPLDKENSNGKISDVQLDPSMFIDFNKLTLGLIAHYTRDCEDPMHSTLWADVSNKSKLELTVLHLPLPDDLALMPAPFFDRLDNRKLILPIIFPEQPTNEVLHAAGIVASWFGGLASYRGAQFPVLLNALPKGNAVLMLGSGAVPAGLDIPPINGPALSVITNPQNPNAKLLVIMGRTAGELEVAVQALVLGKSTLAGRYVNVTQMSDIPERKPYDAPNWIPTDRPVRFGEMANTPDLQVEGISPDVIKVNFSIPPDIFSWKQPGIPMNLHYRYTPRPKIDKSMLNVNINDLFVKALPLSYIPGQYEKKLKLPFLEDGKAVSQEVVPIPYINMYGQNQLQFHYYYDYTKEGSCKDVYLNNERGAVDPDSTIDFSSFPHFTALPNLRIFANDGFPYTRMADLSETAVVMPDNASATEMETYLLLMGRMGKVTGYPALRHVVIQAANVEAHSGRDLILIGTAGNQPLLARWANNMHPLLDSGTHSLKLPGPFERLLSRWENRDLEDAMRRAGDLVSKGDGALAAMYAFESPLKKGRSVVVFTGDNADQIYSLSQSMTNSKTLPAFEGDLVMQSGRRIEGFQLGPTYYVGSLPIWTSIRWYLANQPFALLALVVVVSLLVAALAFRYLRRLSALRLRK